MSYGARWRVVDSFPFDAPLQSSWLFYCADDAFEVLNKTVNVALRGYIYFDFCGHLHTADGFDILRSTNQIDNGKQELYNEKSDNIIVGR